MDYKAVKRRAEMVLSAMGGVHDGKMYLPFCRRDLARATGMPISTLDNILFDERGTSLDTMRKISRALNVRLKWLLFGNENDKIEWIGGEPCHYLHVITDDDKAETEEWLKKLSERFFVMLSFARKLEGLSVGEFCKEYNITNTHFYKKYTFRLIKPYEKAAAAAGLTLQEAIYAKDVQDIILQRKADMLLKRE